MGDGEVGGWGCTGAVGGRGTMLWCLIIYLFLRDLGGWCCRHGRGH